MKLLIALDGQAGSGKGTLAKMLAERYNLKHLDTGKLYRAVAAIVVDKNIDHNNHIEIAKVAQKLTNSDLNHPKIRHDSTGVMASVISKIPEVRKALMKMQKDFAKQYTEIDELYNGTILDGRDIGTVILPDAPIKIFLTASPEERAKRRLKDMEDLGIKTSYKKILRDIIERDKRDKNRAIAPMKPAKDALIIDSTDKTIKDVFNIAKQYIDNIQKQKNFINI